MSINVYHVLKPILIIAKIFRLTSFNFSERYYKISKVNIYINISLCLIYLTIVGFNFYEQNSKDKNVLLQTTNAIKVGVSTILILAAWMYSGRYQKRNIFLIMRLTHIDKDMQKLGMFPDINKILKENYLGVLFRLLVYTAFSAFEAISATYQYAFDYIIFDILLRLLLKFPLFVNTIVHLEMLMYVRIIRNNLKTLNTQLNSLETTNNGFLINTIKIIKLHTFLGTKLKTLRVICPIHHELCKISEIINERYGFVLLMAFLNTFIYTVVNLYLCNTIWRKTTIENKETVTVVLIMECFVFVVETIYACHICNTTVEESNKSAVIIHKIDTDNNMIKDQIAMFSLQIAHKRMEFSAAGLFSINYTLIFSIIGGVTANLVILIQFSAT